MKNFSENNASKKEHLKKRQMDIQEKITSQLGQKIEPRPISAKSGIFRLIKKAKLLKKRQSSPFKKHKIKHCNKSTDKKAVTSHNFYKKDKIINIGNFLQNKKENMIETQRP